MLLYQFIIRWVRMQSSLFVLLLLCIAPYQKRYPAGRCRRGGNLPPATWRIQLVPVNGKTQYTERCSGVDPTPSSPARGWHRRMLRVRTSNEWPYGQWRQIAAATVGVPYFGLYHSTLQIIHPTWRIQPVGMNGTTCYTEQCSGVDPTPSSPGEGLAPWQI